MALESGTRLSRMGPDFLGTEAEAAATVGNLGTGAEANSVSGLWAGVRVREPVSTRWPRAYARAHRTWKGGAGSCLGFAFRESTGP